MKDKIEYFLVMVVHVMNVPFFIVRMLIMFIPIVLGSMIAGYTDYEYCHFAASMIVAAYISGPIGMISRMLIRKIYGIDDEQLRDYVIEAIRGKLHE